MEFETSIPRAGYPSIPCPDYPPVHGYPHYVSPSSESITILWDLAKTAVLSTALAVYLLPRSITLTRFTVCYLESKRSFTVVRTFNYPVLISAISGLFVGFLLSFPFAMFLAALLGTDFLPVLFFASLLPSLAGLATSLSLTPESKEMVENLLLGSD